ncbi:2-dehydro-3-deoxyphosphogalactonate aldolase [Trabulsiella guamensis ATCC 49490]|uniref:2-dehydro-3-deoxyphosphogalactonate aldolase n=1 Tax=Trabulsiella guamensis ATCC 49490 TaxID=1005994 RepID=A0A085A2M5_9ENTR|nr:2-dehydro-3-deoxy-6-phosphogalactonate aldolase [Trabulsiella guamensis]KFC04470.1 2-dehydro-3-deoxyphosphogalactonate aldolase [Trabulsiella guamensis ATCC 49490]
MNPEHFYARWQDEPLPLIAILRGITPPDAQHAAEILLSCGFHWLEVPLNSPSPYESIRLMCDAVNGRAYVGAGTVLTTEQVDRVAECGGQLIISPNCDKQVIRHTRERGLLSLPGIMTPSEAFAALHAGASALKFFPAEQVSPALVKAFRAVLPADVACLPVGGIQPDAQQMQSYVQAGANGFGLGGGLYQAGMSMTQLRACAMAYQQAWRSVGE